MTLLRTVGRPAHLHAIAFAALTAAFLAPGCATLEDSLPQRLARERWEQCKDAAPGVGLKEIRPDGQIWVTYRTGGELRQVNECLARAQAAQGQRAAGAPAALVGAPIGAAAPLPEEIAAPVWAKGDEWAFRNEQPSGASTFVWSVDRTEAVDGTAHYVVKAGNREIFHRVADLAVTQQRVSGRVTNTYLPSWLFIPFPLSVGKTWELVFTEAFPAERQTQELALSCAAEAEELVDVPAGTFNTIRVLCKNARTGKLHRRFWYCPAVKHMVREEAAVAEGVRKRELIAYKLRGSAGR